ncbi:hypothetical protein L596_007863 [Steinernema carpocapsae]|uniref:DNA/RNA-binding domain-containing protein n=1 Tax=Steinernema carpocapsae TaxID=34508 RepID=A0A4U5PAN9_STECR|nr:hypothetical protein L596_007863 [Steinernema carpocapsae]
MDSFNSPKTESLKNGAALAELQTKFRAARKALPQQLMTLKGLDILDPCSNTCLYRVLDLGRRLIESDEANRRKTVETLWTECIYAVIDRIRRCKFDDDVKASFSQFTNAMAGFLLDVAALHPELNFTVLRYCGDLARYRALHVGPSEYYMKVAETRYIAALGIHEADSSIYNRLGVLYQKEDLFKSFLCFAYVLTHELSLELTLNNVQNMDPEKLPETEHKELLKLTIQLVKSILSSNSVEVKPHEWENFLKEDFLDGFLKSLKVITQMSLYLSRKGTQEAIRSCIFTCHSLWSLVIEMLVNKTDEVLELDSEKRRKTNRRMHGKKYSDSEDSESEKEDEERDKVDVEKLKSKTFCWLRSASISLACWINEISEDIGKHNVKIPIFTQEQLSALTRGLTELVNPQIESLRPFISNLDENYKPQPLFVDIENKPEEQFKLLAFEVNRGLQNNLVPISLNHFLEFNSNRQISDVMENMAKLRMESEHKLEDEKAKFPVYILPDLQVLQTKLNHLKRLLSYENAPKVIIGKSILATLDKNKKGCANIREAIRWIQALFDQSKCVMGREESLIQNAEAIMRESMSESFTGVLATVVVCEPIEEKSEHACISVETVDSLTCRWREAVEGDKGKPKRMTKHQTT